MEKIKLTDDDGKNMELSVLEETKINGMYYLLAEKDEECFILKDVSGPEDAEAVYEFITDDDELKYIFQIFKELMEGSGVDLSE